MHHLTGSWQSGVTILPRKMCLLFIIVIISAYFRIMYFFIHPFGTFRNILTTALRSSHIISQYLHNSSSVATTASIGRVHNTY